MVSHGRHRLVPLLAASAAGVALAGCGFSPSSSTSTSSSTTTASASPSPAPSSSPTTPSTSSASSTSSGAGDPSGGCPSVPDVVARTEPSVVTVRTGSGLGSGIVYRKDIVLTDQHVVARSEGSAQVVDQVEVLLADGSTVAGKVVGSDVPSDLAVIRVQGRRLPPATFRTELPRAGETVLALGAPLGFSSSVTRGVVSALDRNLPAQGDRTPLTDLIQTDAAISPGNSGGALVDACGRVIGVNEAYLPPSTGAVSLGFATPAVIAVRVADQLVANGRATHPRLGISITQLTPETARSLDAGVDSGVVVVGVTPGGPADRAGIRRGDVIVGLGEKPVAGYADLLGALRAQEPGDRVVVHVRRNGKTEDFDVVVGAG